MTFFVSFSMTVSLSDCLVEIRLFTETTDSFIGIITRPSYFEKWTMNSRKEHATVD
jgi:hypothetical protein